MSARDVIAEAIPCNIVYGRPQAADGIISAITSSGFRILGPDELDAVTVEKCVEVAWNATISTRSHPHDAFRDEPIIHREIIATAIRALTAAQEVQE